MKVEEKEEEEEEILCFTARISGHKYCINSSPLD
jgi:hypothetical protein